MNHPLYRYHDLKDEMRHLTAAIERGRRSLRSFQEDHRELVERLGDERMLHEIRIRS